MSQAVRSPEDQALEDAAKRIKEAMDLHAIASDHGWAVCHLADGKPMDHTAYPTWQAAVKAARWDRDNFMYLEIQPDGMPLQEAIAVLKFARFVHSQGWRIPDPTFNMPPGMPAQRRDRALMARQLVSGKPLVPEGYALSNLPAERPQPVRRQFRKVSKRG